ncbi:MAG: S8 family peptidase [Eubacteriales bacterium]|nr:S8 family peptidase [Eubacteriales bacterium]
MPLCELYPASEEYADFIVRYGAWSAENLLQVARTQCVNFITPNYAVVFARLDRLEPISIYRHSYNAIPKLFGLLDITALESSGIPPAISNPALNATGRGVILGIIDTGIDYTSPLFRRPDGTSRILSLWDQTIRSEEPLQPVAGFQPFFGSVYQQDAINQALRSEDPFQVVPSRDTDGHGTFLAGVAAANEITQPVTFSGAAPEADLAVVKLKPAKQYLRDFFLIAPDVPAYQENDIMSAVSFLQGVAATQLKPLVILLGVGTSQGSHDGSSPLGIQLQSMRGVRGLAAVTGAGNEVGYHHHFLGTIAADQDYEDVELRVAPGEPGFCAELWASGPELYTVGFISPSGEVIDRIPLALGSETVIPFRLDTTRITLNYQPNEAGSGNQLIFMRFQTPSQGIWRIRVYLSDSMPGQFHIWLPMHGFVSEQTIFLRPNPNTTITDPGNVPMVLTAGAYNHVNDSIFIHSSRGFSASGQVKPDLTAPGVEVQGPAPSSSNFLPTSALSFTRRTGTSVSAAIAAGAVADLLTWAITDQHDETMNSATIRSMLVRGADRNPALTYPSREWGYGTLNLYRSFSPEL